jgi:hypothetical protein
MKPHYGDARLRPFHNARYPIAADNLMHAALLFALQMARRKYGPKGRCIRLDLGSELRLEGATFEASVGTPAGGEPCRFTVRVDRRTG